RRGVVNGHDEAEVDRAPETSAVLSEGLADRRLVAPQGTIPLADSVELAPAPIGQTLLAVRDVANLRTRSTRVSVVAGLDEEHVSSSPLPVPRSRSGAGLAPPRRQPAPT